jgi:hypothetical protein
VKNSFGLWKHLIWATCLKVRFRVSADFPELFENVAMRIESTG